MRQWFLMAMMVCSRFATAQNNADIILYRFELELNDKNDTIRGRALIRFVTLASDTVVSFDLTSGSVTGKKGMKVSNAFLSASSSAGITRNGIFSHQNDKLKIRAFAPFKKGDTLEAVISYEGVPADGLIISKNKYGHRTFFADNWPNRGHNWIPCHDDPADKAAVEFLVTAPRQYQVVANGVRLEETDLPGNKRLTYWSEDVPISTKVMVIGVAEFAVQLAGIVNGCIPVYSWVYPEEKTKGFYDYAQAVDILNYYIKTIGPYAFKKLANVESKTIFGGLENANTIFYSESSVSGTRENEELMAHEIAHQWFGNMATERTFAHLWLSEGFATYMALMYFENKYGTDRAQQILEQDRDEIIGFTSYNNHPVVDNNPDYMQLLNPNSYQKGSWVLHMLRKDLGDSVFRTAIRKYYSIYAGSTAVTDDLRRVFESVSGKNLETFFKQWLEQPGIPNLKISWKYEQKLQAIQITVIQLQNQLFTFPLEIATQPAVARFDKINISKKSETFTIPVKVKPASVLADPGVSLLFQGSVTETR